LVVGGDGRYYNDIVTKKIMRMALAHNIDKVVVGEEGLMSTPATSLLIRKLNENNENCLGACLLTASHNPSGPKNDWGIKFNTPNGGPAQEDLTDKIFENTKNISEILLATDFTHMVDLRLTGSYVFTNVNNKKGRFEVQVVSSTDQYVDYMKELFDFPKLKAFVNRPDFSVTFDAMCGVAGPYAWALLNKELGVSGDCLSNCKPLPNFGNLHPDPNLVYADQLVEKMQILKQDDTKEVPEFGAACDGDADRNMILGKRFFVTPSDSVALLAANAKAWSKKDMTGVARSMPTSGALDQVAKKLGLD